MKSFTVSTGAGNVILDITDQVRRGVAEAGIDNGVCTVFVPHTTCGITINENADPDVKRDILMELDKIVPSSDGYLHREGNSAGHIKTILTGTSVQVPVEQGRLTLGTWQGIYLCEYDGPRTRKVFVQMVSC